MNPRIVLPILALAATFLLGGCAPANTIADDGIYLVYQVSDEGQSITNIRTHTRYTCYVYCPDAVNRKSPYSHYALLTNTRYNVGDRVVITRVPLSDGVKGAKVEGQNGATQ